jgi:hypothetical protein
MAIDSNRAQDATPQRHSAGDRAAACAPGPTRLLLPQVAGVAGRCFGAGNHRAHASCCGRCFGGHCPQDLSPRCFPTSLSMSLRICTDRLRPTDMLASQPAHLRTTPARPARRVTARPGWLGPQNGGAPRLCQHPGLRNARVNMRMYT